MIIDSILTLLTGLLTGTLDFLPTLDVDIPSDLVEQFFSVVDSVAYFLPIGDLFLMLGIWLVVANFSIIWTIICKVYDLIPFV